ncbi:uncharacterized protein BX664DRAFT_321597 [Halteromyces radiatus]|uniref:uncharacterized protein n=1 Tax=Halteromyces radiatus TaxID=101107 RepID=UPI002220E8B6|nr:uncharacterized protein BX664DRAFT_321597 [Halteromyces radiatus]KAI8099557.1 hypothetical protein BX664DRAFT_321597 [Halteromyces radiatus]
MPSGRLRSQSTSSSHPPSSTPHSPLLSRGFASLRRSHRHTASATEQRQTIAVMDASLPQTSLTESIMETEDMNSAGPSSDPIQGQVHEHRIRLVPNVGMATRCFVFDVIERTLHSGVILKLGRYSDRNACSDRLSFKSKVVSRCHAEIWQEDGKIYIKDSGSSSGTFVNRARLSPANTSSRPYIIQDGDLIQLGVDYKGGVQPMYRAVRMRFEVDRSPSLKQTAFSRAAFRQLKHCLRSSMTNTTNTTSTHLMDISTTKKNEHTTDSTSSPQPQISTSSVSSASSSSSSSSPSLEIQECCICLYSMGPSQALFIAPCSHIFHYRCLRPILTQNFPGFSCPLCRTYSDLDATVAIEKDEVENMLRMDHEKINGKKNNAPTNNSGIGTSQLASANDTTLTQPSTSGTPDIHDQSTSLFDDVVTSDTDMEMGSSETAHRLEAGNPTPRISSQEQDDDDDEDRQIDDNINRHHSTTSPTTPTAITGHTTLRQRKSTGHDGLLSTTLVGSPSPFELMIHQHALPISSTPPPNPASTMATATATNISASTHTMDSSHPSSD